MALLLLYDFNILPNCEISSEIIILSDSDVEIDVCDSDDDSLKKPSGKAKPALRRLKKSKDQDDEDEVIITEAPSKPTKRAAKQRTKIDASVIQDDASDVSNDFGTDYVDQKLDFEDILRKAAEIGKKLETHLTDFPPRGKVASSAAIKKFLTSPSHIQASPNITRPLKDYQVIGLNWLRLLHLESLNGILADEMGLGKTIQTIAFLSWLKEMRQKYIESTRTNQKGASKSTKPDGASRDPSTDHWAFSESWCDWPTLLVAPTSTIENWKRELQIWAPQLNVEVFTGSQAQRFDLKSDIRHYYQQHQEHYFDVLIVTYQGIASKYDANFFKHGIRFHYMIVDEAQMIKGVNTSRYTQISSIRAVHRLLLTGTPLQNNLTELAALLAFIMPNLFGSLVEFSLNNDFKQLNKVLESSYIHKIKSLLQPFILRRLKSHVGLGLLPKQHELIHVPATDIQAKRIQQLLTGTRTALTDAIRASPGPNTTSDTVSVNDENTENNNDSEENDESSSDTTAETQATAESGRSTPIGNILMDMRKAALHPIFLRTFYTTEEVRELATTVHARERKTYATATVEQVYEHLELHSDWQLHKMALNYPTSLKHLILTKDKLFESSGKFLELKRLLPRLKSEGHRVVLFSQFTMLLDVLQEFLTRELQLSYVRMDGSTPTADRQKLMDLFNTEPDKYFIFLASTLAGGLGVNLTSADTVIFYDQSFNAQVDRQAEDRCHRLGQDKQVTVYNLVVPGSVEEHMYRLANAKKQLNDIMLNEGQFAEAPLSKKAGAKLEASLMRQVARSMTESPAPSSK